MNWIFIVCDFYDDDDNDLWWVLRSCEYERAGQRSPYCLRKLFSSANGEWAWRKWHCRVSMPNTTIQRCLSPRFHSNCLPSKSPRMPTPCARHFRIGWDNRLSTMIFDVHFSTARQRYFDSAHTVPVNFEHFQFVAATAVAVVQPIAPFAPLPDLDRHFSLSTSFFFAHSTNRAKHTKPQLRIASTLGRTNENKEKLVAISISFSLFQFHLSI